MTTEEKDEMREKINQILKDAPIDKSLGFPNLDQLELWNYFDKAMTEQLLGENHE